MPSIQRLRKWVWLFIERIAELADDVVSILCRADAHILAHRCLTSPFLPRLLSPSHRSTLRARDVGNDCLMTIDGTNYRILQKGAARKGNAFSSFKYAGKSALCYKLGVDILTGNLVWVSGPYPAG
jgi:hypothetical protein